jgi:hypothetical protein
VPVFEDVLRPPPPDDLLRRLLSPLDVLYDDEDNLARFEDASPSIGLPPSADELAVG